METKVQFTATKKVSDYRNETVTETKLYPDFNLTQIQSDLKLWKSQMETEYKTTADEIGYLIINN